MDSIRKSLLFLLLIGLHLLPVQGQKAAWGKMSPMLRQLAREQWAADGSMKQSAQRSTKSKDRQVCALLRIESPYPAQVLSHYGATEITRVGDISIASIPVSRLAELSLDSRVLAIQSGERSSIDMDLVNECLHVTPAHEGRNLPQAFTGSNVMMGVMDIGFDLTHPNFYDSTATHYRIERFWDMLSADTIGSSLYVGRDYGGQEELLALAHARDGLDQTHGTHTLGIAAGSGYRSPYRGVAPESRICVVANAVVDDLPFISEDDVDKYTYATDALGFKYIFDYADQQGVPCVISFSEGSPQDFWGYDKLYYELLDQLCGPGHIIVSSAGNKGSLLSWMHKDKGQPSAGTFITAYQEKAMLTLKTDDCDSLLIRFVAYGAKNDTLLIPLSRVLACPDSILLDTFRLHSTPRTIGMELQAYPSCYVPEETCFDVILTDTLGSIGSIPHLSFELIGAKPEAEAYCGNFYFRQRSENTNLNDAEKTHNINSPASAPSVICVGGNSYRTDYVNYLGKTLTFDQGTDGIRGDYSSVGPTMDGRIKPDVLAPGTNVISSYSSYYLENHPDANDINSDVEHFEFNGRTYAWNCNSGTSMAAPCVGGAIALWLQAKPDLTPQDVMGVIARTSRHYDPALTYPNNYYGYGEIDVYAGLIDLLGLDKIESLDQRHTPARIAVDSEGQRLSIDLTAPALRPFTLTVYTLAGKVVQRTALPAGNRHYSVALSAQEKGVFVLQLQGENALDGSTLIRR